MKRLLALVCMAMMSGCANLKEAGGVLVDGALHPPAVFLDYLQEFGRWLLSLLLNALSQLDPTKWF